MKKLLFLLILILSQSCWICPERHKIEFDNDTKKVKVLSDGYFIESIKMTEYIPKEGYIEPIDSNYVNIIPVGKLEKKIDLNSITKNYTCTGINIEQLLTKKEIAFEIWVKNPDLEIGDEDAKSLVYFVTDSKSKGKTVEESNGCK
ncbi:hypothetical protein [Flavobacterium oreochromis]|uniref:hypothetical protein n=1 Tax=Flavobacterium oreochromis TaxID=2906078 RepID=UPI00385F931C